MLLPCRATVLVLLAVAATGACASLDGLANGTPGDVADAADGGDAFVASAPDARRDSKADGAVDGRPADATLPSGEGGDALGSIDAEAGATLDSATDVRDAKEPDATSHDAGSKADAPHDAIASDDAHDAAEHALVEAGLPDSSVCDAGTVHLASDSENCGACGHSCQGGACMGGACQPVVVTSGSWGIGTVAADESNVYWEEDENNSTGQADIFALALDGGTPRKIAPLQDNPTPLIPSGGLLYYGLIYSKTIVSLTPSGMLATLTTNGGKPQGVAADATNVYWTDIERKAVMAVPLGGGSVTTIAPGTADMASIAVDDTSVYWCEPSANAVVKSSKMGGGTPVTLSSQVVLAQTVLLQGGWLYVSANASPFEGGGIYAIATDGTGFTRLAQPLGAPYYLALDSTFAYWTGLGVGKAPLAGGATTTLVSSGETYGLAVTPNAIFWVEADAADSLMRLAK